MTQILDFAPRHAAVRSVESASEARLGQRAAAISRPLWCVLLVLLLAAGAGAGALVVEALQALTPWLAAEATGFVYDLRVWLLTPRAW